MEVIGFPVDEAPALGGLIDDKHKSAPEAHKHCRQHKGNRLLF